MAELVVPEKFKKALVKLLTIPEKSFEEIISAFTGIAPKFFPEELAAQVTSKVTSVASDDLVEMLTAVLSLSGHQSHDDSTVDELASEVVEAISHEKDGLVKNRKAQKQRLVRLLGNETILVSAKAARILSSNENLFCSARIITDVRPVFGSDPSVPPKASVVVHMLNLEFHHEGNLKEIYVAMDTLDIEALKETLDRAQIKSQSLKALMKQSGITLLDPSE